jgi:hypothetical protein
MAERNDWRDQLQAGLAIHGPRAPEMFVLAYENRCRAGGLSFELRMGLSLSEDGERLLRFGFDDQWWAFDVDQVRSLIRTGNKAVAKAKAQGDQVAVAQIGACVNGLEYGLVWLENRDMN